MKVLVLGGSGMLGHVVVKYMIQMGHDVTFTVRNKVPSWMPVSQPVTVMKFDARDNIPDVSKYDWVINCIGIIKQKKEATAADFYEINAVFPWKLAMVCKLAGVRLIHVSSDCVFNGEKATPYEPFDKADAYDDYGKSKAMGEPENAITIRTSIIGPSDEPGLGLFDWFMRESGQMVPGYTNHTWSGVTTLFLAQFMEKLLHSDVPATTALVQLATPPISKYHLLKLMKEVFECSTKQINSVDMMPTVNRAMVSTVETVPDIHAQLVQLREWIYHPVL